MTEVNTETVEQGYAVEHRVLENGCVLSVMEQIYTWKLTLSTPIEWENRVFSGCWCYDSEALAVAQQQSWDGHGEPQGWIREPSSGRRRPGGDASKEFVHL